MNKFESKVRKDIFRFSIITIFIMIAITIILLTFYSVNVRKMKVERAAESYNNQMINSMNNYSKDLFKTNEDVFNSYLNHEIGRNQVFSVFYGFNSKQEMKSDLLLIDDSENIHFSTNTILEEDNAFLHYISIVMRNTEDLEDRVGNRVYRTLDGEHYLLMFYPLRDSNSFNGFAISVINGREVQLTQLDSSVSFIIFDQYNNIFATNSSQLVQTNRGKLNWNVFEENDGLFSKQYEVVQQPISENLNVITFQILDEHITVLYRSILGIIFMMIIAIIQSYYNSKIVSKRTGNSLQIIYSEMEKVKKDSNYLLLVNTEDEFEDLAKQINNMISELSIINREYISLIQLNLEAQKRKLEAQFNPHFLANTLESIRSVMYVDPDVASLLILKMNKILRYSIDEELNEITLEEDIEYVRDYLEINSIRLEEFNYRIDIDPSLNSIKVPKLFLLPFIENSLKYGYKKRRDLKVRIRIKRGRDNTIIFRVIDNAGAINEQKVKMINVSLNNNNKLINHHGLKNTKQRVALMYPNSSFRMIRKLSSTVVEVIIRGE